MSGDTAVTCFVLGIAVLGVPRDMHLDRPQKVTLCALQSDPAVYDHQLIDVDGVVSHGFEDFTLSDPACARPFGVWLEYGGTISSGTIYCCGVSGARMRPEPLRVENISVPLVEDATFKRFDARVQRDRHVTLRATLRGRFFAGRLEHQDAGDAWRGYGHMGCCSLLVIQQVLAFASAGR